MKIVFLDIDGVLNSREAQISQRCADDGSPANELDPRAVARLNRLVELIPEVRFVLSGSWRIDKTAECVQSILESRGFSGELIGETPLLHERSGEGEGALVIAQPRGVEIAAWLSEHPEVTSFAILDDDGDMAPHMRRLVKTQFEIGLTADHVETLATLLCNPAWATQQAWAEVRRVRDCEQK